MDIDNILMMAETRSFDEMKNSATDELLSQFKVITAHMYVDSVSVALQSR